MECYQIDAGQTSRTRTSRRTEEGEGYQISGVVLSFIAWVLYIFVEGAITTEVDIDSFTLMRGCEFATCFLDVLFTVCAIAAVRYSRNSHVSTGQIYFSK